MTWNYRIVKYKDGSGYGLHEVFYNSKGEAYSMTEDPISFTCDTEEGSGGIIYSLDLASRDAVNHGVFDEPEEWAKDV